MSQDPVSYNGKPVEFRPGTLLRFDEAGYVHPNYEDVRLLKDRSGLSASELARLCGLADGRNFRKWTAPPGKQTAKIPYSAWRLLLIECGLVEREMQRAADYQV